MRRVFPTEIGMLGVWDVGGMAIINDLDDYKKYFLSGRRTAELMNSGFGVFWETGGDGHFKIDIRVNQDEQLSKKEQDLIEMESLGHKLQVTSEVLVGSPEVLVDHQDELENGYISKMEIDEGLYKVDIFFVFDNEAVEGDKPPEKDLSAYVVVINSVSKKEEFKQIWDTPSLG